MGIAANPWVTMTDDRSTASRNAARNQRPVRGAVAVAVGADRIRAVLDEHVDQISRDIAALIPDLVRDQVREQIAALLGQLAPSMPSVPAPKRAARTPSPAVKPPPGSGKTTARPVRIREDLRVA
jgi:hypothetical protein